LKEADVQNVLDSLVAELTKKELKDLTALSEKDENNSDPIVRKNQLTPSAVRKSLHKAGDLGDYLFELEHFVGMALTFQHETETVMATDRRCKVQAERNAGLVLAALPAALQYIMRLTTDYEL